MKQKAFREEIDRIQERHAIFFPNEQKQSIQLKKSRNNYRSNFIKGYDLPDVVTMEIELAFKIVFAKS